MYNHKKINAALTHMQCTVTVRHSGGRYTVLVSDEVQHICILQVFISREKRVYCQR